MAGVLEQQGLPRWKKPSEQVQQLAEEGIALFAKIASPKGMMMDISKKDFDEVYIGAGRNEDDTPVEPICRESSDLALFAVTVGATVTTEIGNLFGKNDFALGSMLDSTASEATELTAEAVESAYRAYLKKDGRLPATHGTLRFSPGYCGWHVSGQRALFDVLRPEEIGIELNESSLMHPLKSISGVIIAGEKHIFPFDDTYPFCADCADHPCRERIQMVMDQ